MDDDSIREELFVGQSVDGQQLKLVLLDSGRCGLTRDGQLFVTCPRDEDSVTNLVNQFLQLLGDI